MAGRNSNFDWSRISVLLTPTSPIPGDVKFKVVDEVDQVVATFEAHKIILALHSDHFKNAFFGSGTFFKEKEEGIVVIKETTKEAFEDFLGFNYEKQIEFEKKTLAELYEILNLAEKYQVKELKDRVVNFIKSFPLSIHNVVKVAATTQEFSQFKEESEELYKTCVALLGTHFSDAQSVLNFVSKHDDETIVVVKLLKDVENKNNQPCSNCQQKPCRNGSSILENDLLLPGMLVNTLKTASQQLKQKIPAVFRVERVNGNVLVDGDVIVTFNDTIELFGVPNVMIGSAIYLIHRGVPMLRYGCDQKERLGKGAQKGL